MRYGLIGGLVLLLSGCSTAPPPSLESPHQTNVQWANLMTASHNQARARVGLSPLMWSNTLANYAQSWANYLAQTDCQMLHRNEAGNNPAGYGENLFWGSANIYTDGSRETARLSAAEIVKEWVSEHKYYDYSSNNCTAHQQCGHYTQIIWGNTQRVGCGMAYCAEGEQLWVCNYDPPGNYLGQRPY